MRSIVAIAVALVAANLAVAQPRAVPSNTGDQILFFRAVLNQLGAKPVTQFEELQNEPKSKVLIVLGSTEELEANMPGDRLREFLAASGTVMIATDQQTSPALREHIGIEVSGQLLTGQPFECYRGRLSDCPLLHEYRRRPNAESHPIFRDLPRDAIIATNRPSYLSSWWMTHTPLASYAGPGWFRDNLGRQVFGQKLVALTGRFGDAGRLLALADHSIFIDMMMQPDNNNLEFAFGVARWLTDDGKRTAVLLMENGTIHSSFDVTLTRIPLPPIPPIESLLPIISRRVAALERENVVNRMIQQSVDHSTIMRFTMLALTVGLLAYAAFRFLNIRQRFDPRPKKTATPVETESNLNEAGRELALATFLDLGQDAAAPGAVPVFAVRGGWGESRSWRKRIRYLWDVAGDSAPPISADELRHIHAELIELRSAAAAGVVQFPTAS